MDKNKLLYYKYISMVVMGVILFFILLHGVIFFLGTSINDVTYSVGLQKHVKQNDLSLPFPNLPITTTSKKMYYLNNFDTDIQNFTKLLQDNFIYEEGSYDCKYWTYVWVLYYDMVKDRYNWKMRFITTDNHIFLFVYNETGYCILDLDNVTCFG